MRNPHKTTVATPMDLLDLIGQDLGISEPRTVSQDEVDRFAALTGDHQWIHVDVERARTGPFGSTIVHGFFTLALVPLLLADVLEVKTFSMGVNYGLDRVRFVRPLPPGIRVQGVATLVSATPISSDDTAVEGVQAKASVAVEFADDPGTCCVAEILFRYHA